MVGSLLDSYAEQIDRAYLNSDESLTVSIALKISPDDHGNKLKATISFTADKIQDYLENIVDEDQISLDLKEKEDGQGN